MQLIKRVLKILFYASALAVLLCLILTACSDGPNPSAAPATPTPTPLTNPIANVTPTPFAGILHSAHDPPYDGASTSSVSRRIYDSDVVARVVLISAENDRLRFKVIDSLKGTAGPEIIVHTSTTGRDTRWDDREGILFLTIPEEAGEGESINTGSSDSSPTVFEFTGRTSTYRGAYPTGYTLGTRSPAWLPASTTSSSDLLSSAFQPDANPSYLVGSPAPGRADDPPVDLAEIVEIINWMGKNNDTGYHRCIIESLFEESFSRDWAAFYGESWTPSKYAAQIHSGRTSGTLIDEVEWPSDAKYYEFSTEGPDAVLFRNEVSDVDQNPLNGYRNSLVTVRPIPAGLYTFMERGLSYEYVPCNYDPVTGRGEWMITVTAPEGTLHEAFFDPVALASGVGAAGTLGVLDPDSFSVGGTDTTISGLRWDKGAVVLTLSPYTGLSGHKVEFIALDGSISLSLDTDSATGNSSAGTLSWGVESRPWKAGDLLMLRISVVGAGQ